MKSLMWQGKMVLEHSGVRLPVQPQPVHWSHTVMRNNFSFSSENRILLSDVAVCLGSIIPLHLPSSPVKQHHTIIWERRKVRYKETMCLTQGHNAGKPRGVSRVFSHNHCPICKSASFYTICLTADAYVTRKQKGMVWEKEEKWWGGDETTAEDKIRASESLTEMSLWNLLLSTMSTH